MRATGPVPAEAWRDLLEAAPRANITFGSGDAIHAMPVAFRFRAGRCWIASPDTTGAGARPPGVGPGWLYRAADGQQSVFVMTGEPARKP